MIETPFTSYVAHFRNYLIIPSMYILRAVFNLTAISTLSLLTSTLNPWLILGQLRQKPKDCHVHHTTWTNEAESRNQKAASFLTPKKVSIFTRLTGLVDPRGTSSAALRRVQQQSSRQQRHHPKTGIFIPPCHSREQSVSCLAATSNAKYLKEAYRRHIRVPFYAQWRSKKLISSMSFTQISPIST